MKKQALPVWALPAAGAAIGGTAGLLGGINIDDPRITPSIRAKKLLRCLLLGGVTGLGLEGMRQGGNLIFKQSSYKPKGQLLRTLLLKNAATGDPTDPLPEENPAADATTGAPAATTTGTVAGTGTGAGAGANTNNSFMGGFNSWANDATWGVPNHYLLGGGIGALGGLTLYHLLNDKRKRNLSGYLGSALAGLGVGALGAGLYRMTNGYNLLNNNNPGETHKPDAPKSFQDSLVRNDDGTINVEASTSRNQETWLQAAARQWGLVNSPEDLSPDDQLDYYNRYEDAKHWFEDKYKEDNKVTTVPQEAIDNFTKKFNTEYFDDYKKNGSGYNRRVAAEASTPPVNSLGISSPLSPGLNTSALDKQRRDPTFNPTGVDLNKNTPDAQAAREAAYIIRDQASQQNPLFNSAEVVNAYKHNGINLTAEQTAKVISDAKHVFDLQKQNNQVVDLTNKMIENPGIINQPDFMKQLKLSTGQVAEINRRIEKIRQAENTYKQQQEIANQADLNSRMSGRLEQPSNSYTSVVNNGVKLIGRVASPIPFVTNPLMQYNVAPKTYQEKRTDALDKVHAAEQEIINERAALEALIQQGMSTDSSESPYSILSYPWAIDFNATGSL